MLEYSFLAPPPHQAHLLLNAAQSTDTTATAAARAHHAAAIRASIVGDANGHGNGLVKAFGASNGPNGTSGALSPTKQLMFEPVSKIPPPPPPPPPSAPLTGDFRLVELVRTLSPFRLELRTLLKMFYS